MVSFLEKKRYFKFINILIIIVFVLTIIHWEVLAQEYFSKAEFTSETFDVNGA
jgi:hypothetical protein